MLDKRAARALGVPGASRDAAGKMARSASSDSISSRAQEPVLGLSADPGRDIDEALQELREEVEKARAEMEKGKAPVVSRNGSVEGKKES